MKININFPENKKFDVTGMGMNAIDHIVIVPHFPEPDTKSRLEHYEIQGGGQIGTAMVAASRLGLKCKCLGKVGDDWQGELSLKLLKDEGIDVADMIILENATNQFAFIMVSKKTKERTIMAHRHEKLELMPGDFPREAVTSAKTLLLDGSGGECSVIAARQAKDEGIPVMLDIEKMKQGVREMLELSDIIISDEKFAANNYPGLEPKEFLEKIREEFNPSYCGITLGDKGSAGLCNGEYFKFPAYKVDVIDTTGCGDVYHAAFLYGAQKGWDVPEIIKFSNAAAGLKCRCLGGRKGAPGVGEVKEFLKSCPEIRLI